MSTLAYLAVGFAAACVLGIYATPGIWLFPMALCCGAGLLGCFCLKSKLSETTIKVLCGCLAGFLWMGLYCVIYLQPALKQDGAVHFVQMEATDYSYETEYGTSVSGKMQLDGHTYPVKVYLDEQQRVSPGDKVEGYFLLRYTADGGSRSPTYHQGMGIFLLGYGQGKANIQRCEQIPIRYFAVRLRTLITDILDRIFPDDTIGFARALLLGDDRLLEYDVDRALKLTGLRHVIAVSGLHVSVLFGLLYTLCGKQRILTAMIAFPVLLLFAAVAGFSPSITRACVMQMLMISAMVLNREYDPPTALAAAVLIMLAINPFTVTSVSFQLSVASIAGILLCCAPLQQYFLAFGKQPKKKPFIWLKNGVCCSVAVSLSVMVLTTPLCACYFGMVSTVSILTNLLALWAVTVSFCGIVLSCVAGAIWIPVGQVFAQVCSWPVRYVLMISDFFSKFPYSAVYTSSVYIVVWLIFCYVLLMVFLKNKKKQPALFAGCIVVGLVAAILCTTLDKPPEGFAATVIDVGQGQCVLLQTEEEAYLVDCGNTQGEAAADIAIAELMTRGVTNLDGVIVTHYDKDHAAGVNSLLGWIDANALYLSAATPENELRQQIVAENADILSWVTEITVLELSDGKLTIYPSSQNDDPNESSLCVLFQSGNYDILITGDRSIAGEEELLEQTELPQLELLIAGHHGSDSSTGLALLSQTRPAVVAISVGEDNSYGHPHKETLQRLALFDCDVLRTDEMGTITFGR